MLSVIVTIVDAGPALERCLAALEAQEGGAELDVIVPWDASVAGMEEIALRHPRFRFPAMGPVATKYRGPGGKAEFFDRRSAAGLGLAQGELVAILDDCGVPRRDWARTVVAEHARLGNAVIGGAVENGRQALLNRAAYFCDFSGYQLPYEAGPRAYVSDVNICYKRHALEATRGLWKERYHETTVHWALQRAGETLFLSDRFVVDQVRDGITLGTLLSERVCGGRLFAATRSREASRAQRLGWAALAPALPFVLFLRHLRQRIRKRRDVGAYLSAGPVVLLLLTGWSLGEMLGYLTGEP
jgi:hypothetical protein